MRVPRRGRNPVSPAFGAKSTLHFQSSVTRDGVSHRVVGLAFRKAHARDDLDCVVAFLSGRH